MALLTGVQVWQILDAALDSVMSPTRRQQKLIVTDEAYTTISVSMVKQSIVTDPVLGPASYLPNAFDCDDYCIYLKSKLALAARSSNKPAAFAAGCIITQQHAFNFCIDPQGAVALVNTQSTSRAHTTDKSTYADFLSTGSGNLVELVLI